MTTREQEIIDIVRRQRAFYDTLETRSYRFRLDRLNRLKEGVRRFEGELGAALKNDMGRPDFEIFASEIGLVYKDLSHSIKHLKKWMKPRRVRTPLVTQPATSRIHYEPLGVNLIISPFNYPIHLTLIPLVSAIAAGNTVVVKTSEMVPSTSRAIEKLIDQVFDPNHIAAVPGGIPETTLLLEQKFDHIFFTGSSKVGAIVMAAAARHLTPVTLELGGKSPCIVHLDAKMDIAVNRIVYGKFMNAGQSCIAPDYVVVHRDVEEAFLAQIKKRITDVYGEDAATSPDYGRILNERHFDRIVDLLDPEKIWVGGQVHRKDRFIAPTVMRGVTAGDRVMAEEIFGPVLPVMTYETLDDIRDIVSSFPQHPLACYIFSESKSVQHELISRIQFGGGCINHCLNHYGNPNLPFGGVGESGMGRYHGFTGFECFSHQKSILIASTRLDPPLIYPPYNKKERIIRWLMK